MAELVAFRAALLRVGFTPALQDAIVAQGITSITDLVMFQKDHIKRICKLIRERPIDPIDMNIRQEQMLETMRYWVQTRMRANIPINPTQFTLAVAREEAMKLVYETEESTEKDPEVKLPDKFKLSSKWIIFSEAVNTYLNRLKGVSKIPLNYIIRDIEIPRPGVQYVTENEMLVQHAALVGPQFNKDNERVYGIIKQLILEGPAWSFVTQGIDRSAHGRLAWLALRAHYEGESYMNKQKEEAYTALEAVHYKGEKTTFTFEHFTNILTKAYNDLHRYGEPVLESKKVRDLLAKIQDPRLEGAKQTVRITQGYKDNFAAAINFIAESVIPLARTSRSISEVMTEGRGQGRGTRLARGGRTHRGDERAGGRYTQRGGRGRGRGYRGRYYNRGGRNISARNVPYITPQDWSNMSYEEQQRVLTARGTRRQVEVVGTETQNQDYSSQVSAITMPPPAIVAQVTTTSANSAFGGRAAYRNP